MTAVQLKVTLLDIEPPIWRRVLLDGSASLADLHEVLQIAFGWQQVHLHSFEIAGSCYVDPDEEPEEDELDEQTAVLDRVFAVARQGRYEYDFGDDLHHDLLVEAIYLDAEVEQLASCLAGERACPPEDCGGAAAYMELLDALPASNGRAGKRGGEAFDAEAFDLAQVNAELAALEELGEED